MTAAAAIGRDEELEAIQAFLDRIPDGPAALVLSGEAGIGKTILWETGVEEARERLAVVLTCRGVEAEASFAFAALSELLVGVVREVAPELAPPRRRALEVALQLEEPTETAPDAHVIGLALVDVLELLVERRGHVLVALDDAQWLDPSSAAVLNVAVRRLREQRVGLLETVRTSPDGAGPLELERSLPTDRLTELGLHPLSLGALHELLEQRVGLELTRPELVRVHEATAGNPFFALELGRELVRTGTRPKAGRALPMPQSLHQLLGGRLARMPTDTGDVLLQAAALARPTVDLVTAAYGVRDPVVEALAAAEREGVVELDDSRLRFTHPLLASICYEQAPIWKRRAVHRTLAGVVTDAEERARHLALAVDGPDERIAFELDAAAEQAAARGAPGAAGELCELSAELTPDDPRLARRRRLRAGRLYKLAGYRDQAVALLDKLLEEVPPGPERADILLVRISTFAGETPLLLALCDEALVCAADDDARAARTLAFRTWMHVLGGNVPAALTDARAALEKAERVDDPLLLAAVIARRTQAEMWAAEITPGLLERGVEIEEKLGLELDYSESPRLYLARLLMRRGELDRARTLLEELEAIAVARGNEDTRRETIWYLCVLEWLAGHWQRALDRATTAHELGEQIHGAHSGFTGRWKALVETDLGLVEQARASAEQSLAHAQASSNESFVIVILGVLGRLELALGNLQAAGDCLRDLPRRLKASGMNDPTQPIWPDTIETLVALGELDQAHAYLEDHERYAERLQSPLAMEIALRCRGLVCAAEGDAAGALEAYERALADRPDPPWVFERARTLLCLGSVRRQAQQKRAAREALEQALVIFDELGARLWAEKARAELRRISGRRPANEELTETERRVAVLAAQGRSNKEIAAELYMAVSTVEAHLSRVYRKLGIRSRSGLGPELANRTDDAVQT
jgi:ATP/maltotriose-dependent transcriptional regulator MalT